MTDIIGGAARHGRQAMVLLVLGLSGCGEGVTAPLVPPGPPATEVVTATVTDRIGDAFGSGPGNWDLTALTIAEDTGGLTVVLDFSSTVASPMSNDSAPMYAVVDFDLDRDSATGPISTVDEHRGDGGSTGLGTDYRLSMGRYAADSTVPVFGPTGTTGRVKPVFDGSRVTVRVPRGLLGNTLGSLYAAAIVGSPARPSDFAPEQGHLSLDRPAAVARIEGPHRP